MPNKKARPAPSRAPASGEINQPMQPIRIPVPAKIHTKRRPFCGDPTCPCHRDSDLIEEYLAAPFRDGRLTLGELTGRARGEVV